MFHSYLTVANWCRIFSIHSFFYIIIPLNGGYFREWLHYIGVFPLHCNQLKRWLFLLNVYVG